MNWITNPALNLEQLVHHSIKSEIGFSAIQNVKHSHLKEASLINKLKGRSLSIIPLTLFT